MYAKKVVNEVLQEFDVDPKLGLTEKEVVKRREKYGLNALDQKKGKPFILRFLGQFKDILIIILLLAAIVSVLVEPDEWVESVIILVVVLLNAIIGVTQESKAEKSLEALKKLSSPLSKVIRNGKTIEIPSNELVPGDIIIIDAGDFIPADARIIEQSKLQVDESALTGESLPVNKSIDKIDADHLSLGDQTNMLFSSTFTTYGRGIAVVVGTGMNTQIGKIANMLSETKNESTPLQGKLDQIGKVIGFLAIGICVVIFLIETLSGMQSPIDALKTAVALAVAAIPEGLSTVVTVVLAIGVEKMAKEKAIVKKLPAVETLGSTSIVCSDKTGTLTQNKMTIVEIYKDNKKDVKDELTHEEKEMLGYFALCTDAQITIIDDEEKRVGDPTETAMIEANNKYGINEGNIKNIYPRLADLSFDSERKMMTVFVRYNNQIISITKGAPDIILNNSKNTTDKAKILKVNEDMAKQALRVLGIAIRTWDKIPDELESHIVERDLEFIGLVGMIDPARDEVAEAIANAKQAGVRTIMITGDHVVTAKAIAEQLGIIGEGQIAITSAELNKLSDEELFNNIEKYAVYARVAPEDKVRIVKAWQSKGKVVAMTGDGVNDAPALKTADIGCAMGITGTDVSKEAAAMILVDDNFATIISAVREGRGIYKNIQKTVRYLLSSNIGEVLTIFLASIISALFAFASGWSVPLLPAHLLWINLITDSLPSFALGMEQTEDDVMEDRPRPKNESFFANGMGTQIIWQGILVGVLTLISFIIGNEVFDASKSQTMAFLTLSSLQLFHAYNVKSEHSIFSRNTFNNKYLNIAFIAGMGLQFIIIYVTPLASIFKLVPLNGIELLVSLGIAILIVFFMEIYKLVRKMKAKKIV